MRSPWRAASVTAVNLVDDKRASTGEKKKHNELIE
jgi:hypothetical protein